MTRGRLAVVAATHRLFSRSCSLRNLHHPCVQHHVQVGSREERRTNCGKVLISCRW